MPGVSPGQGSQPNEETNGMTGAMKAIVLGVVVYIVAKELIEAMITETVEVGDKAI